MPVHDETTDAELLSAWRSGDAGAGNRLCTRHYDAIARFFDNKLTGESTDLVQETFAVCVKSQDAIRSDFRSYLFGVAFNVLRHYLRKKYRTPEDRLLSASLHDTDPGPSTMWRKDEEKRLLLAALRKLPLKFQTALELKYWEGLKSREIGEVLGVKATTARDFVRRGGVLLREAMAAASGE